MIVKKQFRVGFSSLVGFGLCLTAFVSTGAVPFLQRAQAQQNPPSTSTAAKKMSPVTLEACDKEGLHYLIHAEGGINKPAPVTLLLKVTLIHFDTLGHVSSVMRADSLQVQQRNRKTSWLLQNVHGDELSPKPMQFQMKTAVLDATGITLTAPVTPSAEAKPQLL